jgi:hypothetical protein
MNQLLQALLPGGAATPLPLLPVLLTLPATRGGSSWCWEGFQAGLVPQLDECSLKPPAHLAAEHGVEHMMVYDALQQQR